eukprot:TRINITY_DN73257_c0_g1_i1.p1 TRINITY_DN73257_c0_g1~~TRINITY_DN73257_c0_g1_i1.p1  ORF type:complete len:133 (+),score=27.43 TRINITY_DN73257_c0_g1_i1:43-399(+)
MATLMRCVSAALIVLQARAAAPAEWERLGKGQCKTVAKRDPAWTPGYGSFPVGMTGKSLEDCFEDCKAWQTEKCTAVGYSPAFKACILYSGGPYDRSEYWSGYSDLECHVMTQFYDEL